MGLRDNDSVRTVALYGFAALAMAAGLWVAVMIIILATGGIKIEGML